METQFWTTYQIKQEILELVRYVYDNLHIIIMLEDHDTITMVEIAKK
jgi:hypothetical protein